VEDRVLDLDPVTGVWTGRALRQDGRRVAQTAWTEGRPCAVVFFEVRPVKHLRADDGLRADEDAIYAAVTAWQSAMPFGSVLARSGREEFLAVLPGLDVADAVELNEHVRTLTTSGWSPGYALWTEDLSVLGAVGAAHDDHLAGSRSGR